MDSDDTWELFLHFFRGTVHCEVDRPGDLSRDRTRHLFYDVHLRLTNKSGSIVQVGMWKTPTSTVAQVM
jgi:hypothetical protein